MVRLKKEQTPNCAKCGSEDTIRYGKAKGNQRYLCNSCGFQFSVPEEKPIGQAIEELAKRDPRLADMALKGMNTMTPKKGEERPREGGEN